MAGTWGQIWNRQLGVAQGFRQIAHGVDALAVAGAADGPPPTAAQRSAQGKAERARFPSRVPSWRR